MRLLFSHRGVGKRFTLFGNPLKPCASLTALGRGSIGTCIFSLDDHLAPDHNLNATQALKLHAVNSAVSAIRIIPSQRITDGAPILENG